MKLKSKINIIVAELEGCIDECRYPSERKFMKRIVDDLKEHKFVDEGK